MLAKPQAERKHDSSYTYGAAPAPAPFALPTFGGFAAPAYGAMGSGLGIAGSFSQVYILVCHLIRNHYQQFVCKLWFKILQ